MNFVKKSASLTVAFLGAVSLVGAATAAEYNFNLAVVQAAQSLNGLSQAEFAKQVKERSGGKIEITIHAGGALGYKERDHYDAVRDGAVALAATPFDKFVGLDPVYGLQSLPFLTPTIDSTKTMLDVAGPYYDKAFRKANQTLLFGAPFTPQGIWAKKMIRSPADLKGLKMHTYDVTGPKTMKAAGAAPIQLSWADVVPGLSTNLIEAVLTSDESGANGKFWEYGVKYFNFLGYTMGIAAVTMNLDSYNGLPKDLQKVIRDSAKAAEDWAWNNTVARVEFNKDRMKKGGGVWVGDVPESVINHLKKAGAPRLDEWKKAMGPDSEKILAEFKMKVGK